MSRRDQSISPEGPDPNKTGTRDVRVLGTVTARAVLRMWMEVRIYGGSDDPEDDGARALVDRLRPRGVSREAAQFDVWL